MYNIFTELASKLYYGNKNYSKSNKTVYIPTSQYQLSKEIRCTLLLPYTNKCIKYNKINNQINKIVNDYHMKTPSTVVSGVPSPPGAISYRSLQNNKNNKNDIFFTGTKIVILGSFTLFCFYLFNKRK
jgi:hypothetical protein